MMAQKFMSLLAPALCAAFVVFGGSVCALDSAQADAKFEALIAHFNENDLAANDAFASPDFFKSAGDNGYNYLHSNYSGQMSSDARRKAALYLIFRVFPERRSMYMAAPVHKSMGDDYGYNYMNLQPFIAKLNAGFPSAASGAVATPATIPGGATTKTPGTQPTTPVATVATGTQPKTSVTSVTPGTQSTTPIASVTSKTQPTTGAIAVPGVPTTNPASVSNGTPAAIQTDPRETAIQTHAAAGAAGLEAMKKMLSDAAAADTNEGKQNDAPAVLAVLGAMERSGGLTLLDAAADLLSDPRPAVSQAALKVFKAQAGKLAPKLGSPEECDTWWTVEGKKLVPMK